MLWLGRHPLVSMAAHVVALAHRRRARASGGSAGQAAPRLAERQARAGLAAQSVRLYVPAHRDGLLAGLPGGRCIMARWRTPSRPCGPRVAVIVQELAHLLEPNHTSRFWNSLRAQTPRMEKARSWLQTYGQVPEQEV